MDAFGEEMYFCHNPAHECKEPQVKASLVATIVRVVVISSRD